MLPDAPIVAYGNFGRIDKRDAGTRTQTAAQVDTQRNECRRETLHKARVADQMWKLSAQVGCDVLGVKGFEGAIVRLVKQDQDGHYLGERKFSRAIASFRATGKALGVPARFKRLAKVIDRAEEFEYTHS